MKPGSGVTLPSNINAVLFDLDGTLVDSVPDIADAANRLLEQHSHQPLSLDQVRSMIGNGVKKLVERAFDASGETLSAELLNSRTDEMMAFYQRNLVNKTRRMEGAEDLVCFLLDRDIKLAVVTNKPEHLTQQIIKHFGWGEKISVVVGGDTLPKRKPEPDMLIHACKSMSLSVQDAIMVGDSPADIDAAIAADIWSVAIRGGYTNVPVEKLGANAVLDNLMELQQLFETTRKTSG